MTHSTVSSPWNSRIGSSSKIEYRIFVEDREDNAAGAAGDFDAVLPFGGAEVPVARSGNAAVMEPASGDGVGGAVAALLVDREASDVVWCAEQPAEEIKAMAGEVVEIAARCYSSIDAPVGV